jgi:hypothetical protein
MSDVTLDEVKKRAQAAGLTLRDDRLEMVRRLLNEALAPLGKTDSRAVRTVEPAVTFDATGGVDHGQR